MTRPRGRRLVVFIVTLVDPHGDMKTRAFYYLQDATKCAGAWIGSAPPYPSASEFTGTENREDFSAYIKRAGVK